MGVKKCLNPSQGSIFDLFCQTGQAPYPSIYAGEQSVSTVLSTVDVMVSRDVRDVDAQVIQVGGTLRDT